MKNFFKYLKTTYLMIGILALVIVGLLVYVIYSNNQLKKLYEIQNEKDTTTSTLSVTESTKEQNDTIKKSEAVETKKVAPVVSTSSNVKSTWNTFYEQLAGLEDEFRLNYNIVTLNPSSLSVLDYQKKANDQSLVDIALVLKKVEEGKSKFPEQLTCFTSEKTAFDKYSEVVKKSDIFLKYLGYSIKIDTINSNLESKVTSFALRLNKKEYDQALQLLDEMKPLLSDAKLNAEGANSIIKLQGITDYLKWVNDYSSGLNEIYALVKNKNYDADPKTDFIALGENKAKAIKDWSNQQNDWMLANINPLVADADRAYNQSNRNCIKD